MKKFLLALIAAFVLLLNNPVSSQTCAKAVIDSPNDAILPYDITCNAKVGSPLADDGFCPENYGDWASCNSNAYGGYCNPPDLDCPKSGYLNINVDDVKPDTNYIIKTTVTCKSSGILSNGVLKLLDSNNAILDTSICPVSLSLICEYTFTLTSKAPNTGGTVYPTPPAPFQFQFVNNNAPSDIVSGNGRTLPYVKINPLKKFGGQGQDLIQDDQDIKQKINIPVTASSGLGITKIYALLERKNAQGTYEPANPVSINCLPCAISGCNLIGTIDITPSANSPPEKLFPWDITICDNTEYRIIAKAEDNRGKPGDDYTDIKLNSPTPPPPKPEPSILLNLVSVKIKTWLIT